MKHIKQLIIILLFTLAGETLQALIPLPFPAAIYGFLLLLVALCTGWLKEDKINDCANFLIRIMPVLFVAPAANILQNWDLISAELVPICVITLASTVIVFLVSGWTTQLLIKKKAGAKND